MLNSKKLLIVIFLFGSFARFYNLGIIPVSNDVFWPRFISALLGSLSIIILYFLTLKITSNINISLLTSVVYSILPLSVVENRIISWVSSCVFIFLIAGYLLLKANKIYRLVGLLMIIASLIIFKNNFWFINSFKAMTFRNLLLNFFDSISFRKIFFSNDSYWIGGLRRYGMIFPEAIPLFLIGIYELVKNKYLIPIFFTLLVIIISALNPYYPEAREMGLLAPVFAFFIGLGINSFIKFFFCGKSPLKTLFRIIGFVYLLILLYGIISFFHFYIIHYNFQIKQEKFYELKKI